ncbi:hypothetical protein Sm713_05760 [Streptomyces sp. TS71-3]|nr:hypothetical protein Sm713_05760 [Streptomyces sp. TS71-3]
MGGHRGALKGRGELRDRPRRDRRIVTVPKGQMLSYPDHRPVWVARAHAAEPQIDTAPRPYLVRPSAGSVRG